ncbi:MAG TPA: hypothetical protein PLU80_07310 [Acidobacteriota bacterium]|nr:hypothetical protein [Acidobacteriota bacterium]
MPKFRMETVAYTSDSGATFALTVSPAIKALMPGASNTGINSKTPQMTIRGEKPNPRGYRGRKIGGSADAPDSVFVPVTTQAAWLLLKDGDTFSYKSGTYKRKTVAEKSKR